MTLPEELRQASRYTALDYHMDLLERAAAEIEVLCGITKAMSKSLLEPKTIYVLGAREEIARAALSTQGEKP